MNKQAIRKNLIHILLPGMVISSVQPINATGHAYVGLPSKYSFAFWIYHWIRNAPSYNRKTDEKIASKQQFSNDWINECFIYFLLDRQNSTVQRNKSDSFISIALTLRVRRKNKFTEKWEKKWKIISHRSPSEYLLICAFLLHRPRTSFLPPHTIWFACFWNETSPQVSQVSGNANNTNNNK